MPDLTPPDGSDHGTSALDTRVIPLGERALRGVFDHVVAVGDEAETPYLEVKSPVDMSSKATSAGEAARHFHGYAVLVIGAQKDRAPGVPRSTEAHELEDRFRPYLYLGPQFPAFEFGRIGVALYLAWVLLRERVRPRLERWHRRRADLPGRATQRDRRLVSLGAGITRTARSGRGWGLDGPRRGTMTSTLLVPIRTPMQPEYPRWHPHNTPHYPAFDGAMSPGFYSSRGCRGRPRPGAERGKRENPVSIPLSGSVHVVSVVGKSCTSPRWVAASRSSSRWPDACPPLLDQRQRASAPPGRNLTGRLCETLGGR